MLNRLTFLRIAKRLSRYPNNSVPPFKCIAEEMDVSERWVRGIWDGKITRPPQYGPKPEPLKAYRQINGDDGTANVVGGYRLLRCKPTRCVRCEKTYIYLTPSKTCLPCLHQDNALDTNRTA